MCNGFQMGRRIRESEVNEKRIPSQWTGPVKKKKPILTPKTQTPSQQTHTNPHTPLDPTVFLKSHQLKPKTTLYNLYYYTLTHFQHSKPVREPV